MSAGADKDSADARVADARARERARTHFDSHLILEAGAGSGKTTVLVDRILAWCLGPGFERHRANEEGDDLSVAARALERVTALTFSEAAAAEMESRLAAALHCCAEEGDALHAPRARATLASFERLSVRTIHAFCRRLLSAYPVEAGVHPRSVVDANGSLRARIARELVEASFARASTCESEDLFTLVERGAGPRELERLLQTLLAGEIPPSAFLEDPLAAPRIAAFWQRTGEWITDLAERENADGVASVLARSRDLFAAAAPGDARALAEALDMLRTQWDEGTVASLSRSPDTKTRLTHLLALDPMLLACLHRVLAPWVEKGEQRLQAEGVLSFDDILRRSAALLKGNERVCAELRAGCDQLLVDEFQDTDREQCAILESWVGGSAGVDAPALFVVGDPKQSIYGWRNADLRAYDRFLDQLDAWGAERHRLVVNYRSLPEILDEVDAVIRPQMVRSPGLQANFEALLPCEEKKRAARVHKNGVEYWVAQPLGPDGAAKKATSDKSLELECPALVEDLWRNHDQHGVPWREMALLLRSTGELDRYLDALRHAGIPYAVDRDRVYYRRREVLEAKALLRTVLDPNDQVAWVATLRSVRCGVPDSAWRGLFAEGAPDAARRVIAGDDGAREALAHAVHRVSADLAKDAPGLGFDFAASCLDFHDVLAALRRSFFCDSLDRFIARLRHTTLLDLTEAARYLGAYRLANLDRFFREFAAHHDRCEGDLGALLSELRRGDAPPPDFEEGRPRGGQEDAVQVMTIHGVKGLDFEVVYLLQAHKGSSRRNGDALEGDVRDGVAEYALRFSARRGERFCTLEFDRVQSQSDALAAAETVRTLYVAMTRAKTKLVVSGCLAASSGASLRTHAGLLAPRCAQSGAPLRQLGAPAQGALDFRAPSVRAAESPVPAPALFSQSDPGALSRYAERPYGLAASSSAGHGGDEYTVFGGEDVWARSALSVPSKESRDHAAPDAAAVGTAVHALLETLPADPAIGDAAWHQTLKDLEARLRAELPEERAASAIADALEVLEGFRSGPLWTRFCELGPHLVGREIPFIATPEQLGEVGAVGFGVGAIDLLYRDPESGELVVTDWKSDRVAKRSEIEQRIERYRTQGDAYVRAVADALALATPPRFELWFLRAGLVVPVSPLPASRAKPAHFLRGDSAQMS